MALEWGDPVHPTHTPSLPRDEGFSTAVVYCTACATLLRSSRGLSVNPRVRQPCEVPEGAPPRIR